MVSGWSEILCPKEFISFFQFKFNTLWKFFILLVRDFSKPSNPKGTDGFSCFEMAVDIPNLLKADALL